MTRTSRKPVHLLIAAGLALLCTSPSRAAFINTYDIANFTLTNTNADGTAMSPDNGLTLVLTGGNNGSGFEGTTDFTIVVPTSGTISFNYQYSACDLTDLCDTPGFDASFYLLGPDATLISDTTGALGFISFPVTSQDLFGFRVSTADNTGEPGILTITNFNGPVGVAAVPEPSEAIGVCAALLLVGAVAFARRTRRQRTRLYRRA